MTVFLTSSPTGPLDSSREVIGLDSSNQFVDELKQYWPNEARCLMIAADPLDHSGNLQMTKYFADAASLSNLPYQCFELWDQQTIGEQQVNLDLYDVVFLGGGHVPTQNAFFVRLNLREMFQHYSGLVVGISAGSMNSADIVYAQPELLGEATDPAYQRFLTGLNLTQTMILPHYQMVKDNWLDGVRLFKDITYADSYGHSFIALCDGSYLLSVNGRESIHGEAYCIQNGKLIPICNDGETISICK